MNETHYPVITVDGPSGAGKGTLCKLLAQRLSWHMLDSGALYRVLALKALQKAIALDDAHQIAELASQLEVDFELQPDGNLLVFHENSDVTQAIRDVAVSQATSKISAFPEVRKALLDLQRQYQQAPGLIADGRDMGTAIFPDAELKIYLDASVEERAKRRYKQLKDRGINVSLEQLLEELEQRDLRDKTRAASPLRKADDAILIDTTNLSIEQVLEEIIHHWQQK